MIYHGGPVITDVDRRIKTDIPNIYERSAHKHCCVLTCSHGFSCISNHHWKHLFLHQICEVLIEIWRVGIKKYMPSCFVHYLLIKLEFSAKSFLVTFMHQTNLNFLWRSWVKLNMRFIKHHKRLTFSCNFNCQHSLFVKIQFLMCPKSQFFRELHMTQIHRHYCILHSL